MHDVTTRHFIIATAGHVDHGKSALVKALTGTDPDRLPEEKARQITIDLGFAELNLTAPGGEKIHAGIVDVPGHEDFVRNMIAGVGSIDLALLVVAADDGWMPQTEEHLQILTYLGVQRAVVALAKSDLGNIGNATDEIRNRLRGTPLAGSQIVPTSVRAGEGIENLKRALVSELAAMQPQRDISKPRLFIDRAFTLRGIGTVVTGTLTGGEFRRGDIVIVKTRGLRARIRSIQSHSLEVDCAQPGMRTALSLPDLTTDQIKRGDVITDSDVAASSTVVAQMQKASRLAVKETAARPLRNGSSVYLHHGTSRVRALVTFLQSSDLGPGKQALARLKLASPIFAFVGDRFVIRDASEQHTIAGGIVLDPDGGDGSREAQVRSLSMRAIAPDDVDVGVRSEVALRGFVRRKTFLTKSSFSAGEIAEALTRLKLGGEIVLCGEIAADRELWQQLRKRAIAFIDQAHRRNPERRALDLNEVRAALGEQQQDVFEALISELCTEDFVRKGPAIARRSHEPLLPAELQPVAHKIRDELSRNPFDPPPRREIESGPHGRQVVHFLIENGELIEIAPDLVLLRENFDRMKSRIAECIFAKGLNTVSELRHALGSSRRVMVPLLERLDRDGITRRVGDKRSLR
jgi:selenocysteine-specific elongation factor